LQTALQAAQAVEAAEQQEKAASEVAQAAAAAGFEAEAQAEKLTGVVKQLQVPLLLPDVWKPIQIWQHVSKERAAEAEATACNLMGVLHFAWRKENNKGRENQNASNWIRWDYIKSHQITSNQITWSHINSNHFTQKQNYAKAKKRNRWVCTFWQTWQQFPEAAALSLTRAWLFAQCLDPLAGAEPAVYLMCCASTWRDAQPLITIKTGCCSAGGHRSWSAGNHLEEESDWSSPEGGYTASMLHLFIYSLHFTGCWGQLWPFDR